jgi:hypothetical protein
MVAVLSGQGKQQQLEGIGNIEIKGPVKNYEHRQGTQTGCSLKKISRALFIPFPDTLPRNFVVEIHVAYKKHQDRHSKAIKGVLLVLKTCRLLFLNTHRLGLNERPNQEGAAGLPVQPPLLAFAPPAPLLRPPA